MYVMACLRNSDCRLYHDMRNTAATPRSYLAHHRPFAFLVLSAVDTSDSAARRWLFRDFSLLRGWQLAPYQWRARAEGHSSSDPHTPIDTSPFTLSSHAKLPSLPRRLHRSGGPCSRGVGTRLRHHAPIAQTRTAHLPPLHPLRPRFPGRGRTTRRTTHLSFVVSSPARKSSKLDHRTGHLKRSCWRRLVAGGSACAYASSGSRSEDGGDSIWTILVPLQAGLWLATVSAEYQTELQLELSSLSPLDLDRNVGHDAGS